MELHLERLVWPVRQHHTWQLLYWWLVNQIYLLLCIYSAITQWIQSIPTTSLHINKNGTRGVGGGVRTIAEITALWTQKPNSLMICFDLKHVAYLFRLCTIDFYLKRFDLMMPFYFPSAYQKHSSYFFFLLFHLCFHSHIKLYVTCEKFLHSFAEMKLIVIMVFLFFGRPIRYEKRYWRSKNY